MQVWLPWRQWRASDNDSYTQKFKIWIHQPSSRFEFQTWKADTSGLPVWAKLQIEILLSIWKHGFDQRCKLYFEYVTAQTFNFEFSFWGQAHVQSRFMGKIDQERTESLHFKMSHKQVIQVRMACLRKSTTADTRLTINSALPALHRWQELD